MQTISGGADDTGPANPLYLLERAIAVAQHHDAVSGTSKQHVANDYAKKLSIGRAAADVSVAASLAAITGYSGAPFMTCDLANVSICESLEGPGGVAVAITNSRSVGVPWSNFIRLPVLRSNGSFAVTGADGQPITAQLLPLSAQDEALRALYKGNALPMQWLVFRTPAAAFGVTLAFITPVARVEDAPHTFQSVGVRGSSSSSGGGGGGNIVRHLRSSSTPSSADAEEGVTISNGVLSVTISSITGLINTYSDASTNTVFVMSQNFYKYPSNIGDDVDDQRSGAYIFRPAGPFQPLDSNTSSIPTVDVFSGPVLSEARQTWPGGWVSQVRPT